MSAAASVPGRDLPETPFHRGELAIQERVGVREKIAESGRRNIRPFMPDQHRDFFAQLPFLFAGAVDETGQPWASMLVGQPGFMTSPDRQHLRIAAHALPGDPLEPILHEGAELGLLGIELPTRRRNRMNGPVSDFGADGFTVTVRQSFGNCPQYIQARDWRFIADPANPPPARAVHVSDRLDDAARALIASADTFFIASAYHGDEERQGGVDVSHRGGKPGFVRIDDDATLTSPDFVGNFLFNTIGNMATEPRAGLLFVDFATGDMVQIAVEAEVIWDGPDVEAFAGAERLMRFHIRQVIRREAALPLRWEAPAFSPILARTGDWAAAGQAIEAAKLRDTWRPFRVTEVTREAVNVRSFRLEPADGGGVVPHLPGQHLPIRLTIPGQDKPVIRTYTLSDAADGYSQRISVKRDGLASSWLHDNARLGTVIEALAPRGEFIFDETSPRPVVMISAGIGITPMIAMLNALLVNDGRTRHHNRIIFIHGTRNGRVHAFARHLQAKAAQHANLYTHIRYSQPDSDDIEGHDFDSIGHVDMDLIQSLLPLDDYDFYLCGPSGFMQSIYDGLCGINIADARIRFEAFGPSSVHRRHDATTPVPQADDGEAVEVRFAKSGKVARWQPQRGTLLELAEAEGLSPVYSCRSGLCGTCATKVLSGGVDYAHPPEAEVVPGEALICCSTPHAGPHLGDGLDREGVTLDL